MITNSQKSATTHVRGAARKRLPRPCGFNIPPGGSVTLAVLDHRCDVRSHVAEPTATASSRPWTVIGGGTSLALRSIRLRGFLFREYQCVATLFEILVVVGDQL